MIEIQNIVVENDEKDETIDTFPVKSAKDMTYNEFFQEHMEKNVPCLIRDLMDDWPACQKLTDKNHEPNISFFENLISTEKVPVANCSEKYFNSQEKCEMSLKDYLTYWKSERAENLYLKDWHFVKDHPGEELYKTPKYFSSDWLNEYWENQDSDYKFVYLGKKFENVKNCSIENSQKY